MKNSFKLIDDEKNITKVFASDPQTISTQEINGNVSLSTQIGYLQINLENESLIISSIDGIIPNPHETDASYLNITNCEKKVLQFDMCNPKFKEGVGYSLDFKGDTFYDKNKECLILGYPLNKKIIKIGDNLYVDLIPQNENSYMINALIIKPITLTNSFKLQNFVQLNPELAK